jgi:ligand-binding sensor domain-containing protein
VSGSNIFAGTLGGIFLSTNNGTSWTAVNTGLIFTNTLGQQSTQSVSAFAVSGGNIFAGTGGGVFLSTNNGTSWIAVNSGLTDTNVLSLAVSGGNIFAGTAGGVFLSANSGTSWTAVNSGVPVNTIVNSLAVSDSDIFASTLASVSGAGLFPSGVWRRSLSEMTSLLPQHQHTTPLQTGLRITTSGSSRSAFVLNYSIQSPGLVQLTIYTVSGKRVAVIEQGERTPGEYSVSFDAGRIPAGLYMCRFQAGSYQENNRLMIVK